MTNENQIPRVETIIDAFRNYQNIFYAAIGGFGVSLICAYLWAAVTVTTNYQIGIIAIVLGVIVGYAVRFFGAGVDHTFSILGGAFALLSCLMGNLFTQIAFIAQSQAISYLDVFRLLDLSTLRDILVESFSIMDLIFYGIAAAQGYNIAIRPVTEEEVLQYESGQFDASPPMQVLRKPLAYISLASIVVLIFLSTRGTSGEQTFYHDNGNIMSKGNYNEGKQDGEWEFFFEDGRLQSKGTFKQGLEHGDWEYYDSLGQKIKSLSYKNGMTHGEAISYYNGIVQDSGSFHNNRQVGLWITNNEKGDRMSEGFYERGLSQGVWRYYHDNGVLSGEGKFEKGVMEGVWRYFDKDAALKEEISYEAGELDKVLYIKSDGKEQVKAGNGMYQMKDYLGRLTAEGAVKNGAFDGLWIYYYEDGKPKMEMSHSKGIASILKIYDRKGAVMVDQGTGLVKSTYESGNIEEEGKVENGKYQGLWTTYYDIADKVQSIANYKDGKLDGNYLIYGMDESIYVEGTHKKGLQEGEWKWYYANGNIESKVSFINGKKDGVQRFYNETGLEVKEETYDNGNFVGEKLVGEE